MPDPSPNPSQPQSGSAPSLPTQAPSTRAWVQSGLAIATGYLFLALGVIAIMGLLALQGVEEFTPTLLLILTLTQLCLATAGGYLTALLAPVKDKSQKSSQRGKSLINHSLGLTALVLLLWLISALTSNGQEPWSIQILNLAIALIGISTSTWLRHRQTHPTA